MSYPRPAELDCERPNARAERLALAEAVVLLWTVGFAVRVLPFRVLAARLLRDRVARRRACPPERLAAIVARASAWCWPAPRCLARALVLARLLARHGLDAHLVVGVATEQGRFAAHAWVEHQGRPLDLVPCVSAGYTELCRFDRFGVTTGVKTC
jgi:hypothetical protein